MPTQQQQAGSDWNRHLGVGATLLSNWVEERACRDKVLQERSNPRALARAGHDGLLEHGKSEREPRPLAPERVAKPAPRRQARDAQLLLEALRGTAADESFEQRQGDESRGAAGWCSTHHADYGQPGPESGSLDLGATPPSPADSARFAQPITFWSDFAVKGSGTTISSSHTGALQRLGTPENQHRSYGYQQNRYSFESGYARVNEPRGVVGHRAGQEHQHHASGAAVSFGKHADFSTPIKEYVKAGVKDL